MRMNATPARIAIVLASVLLLLVQAPPVHAQSVGYGQAGYRFVTTRADQLQFPWEQPEFDDSDWALAAPDVGRGSGPGCPLVGDGRWPIGSDLLVRHRIVLPGQASSVELGFAFDNDIVAVYWNGQLLQGEVRHEGCATLGSLVVQVPTELLRRGAENVLAVHVRDRGVISYYDHRITVR
jgi:hypothetical protein